MNPVSGQMSSRFTPSYFLCCGPWEKCAFWAVGIFDCSTWSDHWGQKLPPCNIFLAVLKIPSWSYLLMCIEDKLKVKGQNQLVQFSLCWDLLTGLQSHRVSTDICAHGGDVTSSLFLHHCDAWVSKPDSNQIMLVKPLDLALMLFTQEVCSFLQCSTSPLTSPLLRLARCLLSCRWTAWRRLCSGRRAVIWRCRCCWTTAGAPEVLVSVQQLW